MAEPTDDYCPSPTDEVKMARDCTFNRDNPPEPHYSDERKLMRPQTEQDNDE